MNPVITIVLAGVTVVTIWLIPEWLRRWHERRHR